jgi:hypothetical protein
MVNYINENRDGHIITIEDPIEYYHNHKRCVVTQREVHVDVPSFAEAIRRALRQDPDIILVGEMRDLETIEAAISAAETGHLVFGTLHTNSAAKTIDRIVDAFPANMKDMIRTQLASSLVAVISQVLCKKIGGGRIAGYEIMVNTTSIASLIRDNKTFRIPSDIQTGANLGMITMDTHLMSLVNRELVNRRRGPRKGAGTRGDAREDRLFLRNRALAEGQHIGIVMGAIPDRHLLGPTHAAPDGLDPVGHDGFAVARTAEHNAPLILAPRHSLSHGTDKVRIVAGFRRVGAEIAHGMPLAEQVGLEGFLVLETGVVRADGDGELLH